MEYAHLHFLGIKVVYKHLIDNGYQVLNVRKETDVNPQILATKDGKRYFVVVRTAKFPNMGVLLPHVAANVLEHATKNKAICRFASVGIANANGNTQVSPSHTWAWMTLPLPPAQQRETWC